MTNEEKEILKFIKEYNTHFGTKILEEIELIKLSHRLLYRNYEELRNCVKEFESQGFNLQIKNKNLIHSYQFEIARMLHNYLASTYTLTKHRERLLNKILCNSDINEYFKKESEENYLCHDFLIRLRVYSQHRQLLPTAISFEIPSFKVCGLKLNKSELLGWKNQSGKSNWDSSSLNLLNQLDENIILLDLLKDYQEATDNIYSKLYKKIHEHYSKELKESNSLLKKLDNLI